MARTLRHEDGRAVDLLLDQNGQVARRVRIPRQYIQGGVIVKGREPRDALQRRPTERQKVDDVRDHRREHDHGECRRPAPRPGSNRESERAEHGRQREHVQQQLRAQAWRRDVEIRVLIEPLRGAVLG